MTDGTFVLKGNILYSKTPQKIEAQPAGYLVCSHGQVAGVFDALPQEYAGLPVTDCGDALIVPGLVDLHLHAPQFAFRGLGMDLELLDWLNTHTFAEEAKYADLEYAQKAYQMFVSEMAAGATTRAVVFATVHVPGTLLLMDLLEKSGLVTMVGKVNMNRNCPETLSEGSAEASLAATREWLAACKGRYSSTSPILTPRFIPSCTDKLMLGLAEIQKETGLPVQSHLSENLSEVDWVRELCPESENYGDAYRRLGLFGGSGCPTIMAHCVYSGPEERRIMKENGVYMAHSPNSNTNLSSGIAPVRAFMEEGVRVGLATDVAGGFSASIFRAMSDAIQVSKLYWRLVDNSKAPLTVPEAFYLGTKGGGQFFGKVGSFEPGYAFDALVLDDTNHPCPYPLMLEERLERMVYLADNHNITAKYVNGKRVK